MEKWNFDYLSEHMDPKHKHSVHFAPMETTAFTRHYGKGLGKGGCTPMNFEDFARIARSQHLDKDETSNRAPPLRYYLQSLMVWNDQPKDVHGAPLKEVNEEAPLSNAPLGEVVLRDLRSMGWGWLKRVRGIAGCSPFDTCQLWVGHGGGATPLHFDSVSNFLTQVVGRKQVILFPPAQSFHVYPYPVGHQMDNFAMVDVEKPDLDRFPALRRAQALEAVLEPGEVLWLPRFYWHYVFQLDAPSENISLNFWCGRKGTEDFFRRMRDAPLPDAAEVKASAKAAHDTASGFFTGNEPQDAFMRDKIAEEDEKLLAQSTGLAFDCLHASRMLEAAGVKSMGDDRQLGYQFLQAIAYGSDAAWLETQAPTMKAFKLRQELIAVLGSGKVVNALFRLMTRDGRLYPGLAPETDPNQSINSEKGALTPKAEVDKWFNGARPDLEPQPVGG